MKKQNANLSNVLNVLAQGGYHDGTTIGKQLNITRSAIWKTIKRLKDYGVLVVAQKGKGYALEEPLHLLNAEKIKKELNANIPLHIFESITSTNDYFREQRSLSPIAICLAEQQTQGRGRMGRSWVSPFGLNIYLSCFYRFEKDVSELGGLSLVVGLVVAKTLNEFSREVDLVKVKWPNDVLVDFAKIAGNLIEVQAESHGLCQAVIGIGVNVNMLQDQHEKISQRFTSLRKVTGNLIDRNALCVTLIKNLIHYLQQFEKHGLKSFLQEWQLVDCLINREVSLQKGDEEIKGVVVGVNEMGCLVLNVAGVLRAFSAGDVHVINKGEV